MTVIEHVINFKFPFVLANALFQAEMSEGKAIPIARKDGWQPNPRDLSTTPGGTIYATTPG